MNEPLELIVPASLDGERIDRVVAMVHDRSRSMVQTWIREGRVRVDNTVVSTPSRKCATGEMLEVTPPIEATTQPLVGDETVPFDVVYEDVDLLVVNKPAGVVVHPGSGVHEKTLTHGLLARFADIGVAFAHDHLRPGIVHRLDRGTSGLLVVARTEECRDALTAMLQEHRIVRQYAALVWGRVVDDRGMIDAPLGRSARQRTRMVVQRDGRSAVTHFDVIARGENPTVTYVAFQLETGRTHQIRVHSAAIGHPIVGDAAYRGPSLGIDRPFLHAFRLRFEHPFTHSVVDCVAPLPRELVGLHSIVTGNPQGAFDGGVG